MYKLLQIASMVIGQLTMFSSSVSKIQDLSPFVYLHFIKQVVNACENPLADIVYLLERSVPISFKKPL